MTRIIQRCFLVLAFTGVFLSSARVAAESEVSYSTSLSTETSTSAPKNSFNTAETASSSSTGEKDKNASFTEAAAVESSSHADDVAQTSSNVPVTSFSDSHMNRFSTASSNSGSIVDFTHDVADKKASHIVSHSLSENTESLTSNTDTEVNKQSNDESENTREKKITAEADVTQSNYVTSPGFVSTYSEQNSVPSKEELVINSSYVDKNQSREDMTSGAPSKVQSEETENDDAETGTHKRSLNATNTVGSSTTVVSSKESYSKASVPTPSKLMEREDEKSYSTALPYTHESDSRDTVNHAEVEDEESIDTFPEVFKDNVAGSTSSIISDNRNAAISAGHIMKLGSMVPESSTSTDLKDASLSSVDLDALSVLHEESIHPSKRFESAAQIAYRNHMSTISTIPLKSPNLEIEYEESPGSLVTFDPDGMTHNSSQEPDSVTFSPKIVHGKPTSSYSSNLEYEELRSNEPELLLHNSSTAFATEVVESSPHNMEVFHSSERERETPSANHGLSPHDEPDREIPTSFHVFASTKSPEGINPTNESKIIPSINDESEEMLNDSPYFRQSENKPPIIPTAEFMNKYLNKDLENNISNDISHTSDLKSQNLRELHQELDFPIDYQTQPSEIRPVTAIGPEKTSDTVTDFPILHDIQSQTTSNETKSNHPVFSPKGTSNPIILPNVAPSIVNKSSEKIIVVSLSPDMLPKDYVSPDLLPKDYVPPELLPKDYTTPKSHPIDYASSEMPPKAYIPLEMLPKDYKPEEILPKDYISTEKPPKVSVKPEMLPKDNISLELLPKDYLPPDLLPKDFVRPDILPKDYTPNGGNNTDTNINTTIAGVAVKTSVSVSLPISKSPNSTTGSPEHSAKEPLNTSSKENGVTPTAISVSKDSSGPSSITTEIPVQSTTESKSPRIRKPKLRINSGDDERASPSPRTRKPFLQPPQKSSSTAGPPVSIFRQARTRLASITSSTTARPFQQFSTIRVHYASRIPGMVPGGEMVVSIEPVTTTVPTTTETEEPFSEEPFTGRTVGPVVPTEDNVTLLKVAGVIVVEKGLRWNELLNNRLSPQYKEREKFVQSQLYRLFRTSVIAPQLWKIQIDGFSGKRNSQSVVIDFFLYLIKSQNEITPEQLVTVFHDKLVNNTFSRFTVDTNKTAFEFLNEELMRTTTPLPELEHVEPVIPQWAIAVIVVGAASLIFIVLFAAVAILGRHHVRRRYSNKLNDEDSDRPSDWESKMAAAYENLAADTIYDAEDFHSDSYKKRYPNSTYHGRPSRPRRADSWSSSDWSPPPRRPRPHVHRIVY